MNPIQHEDSRLTLREAYEKHYVPHLEETATDRTSEEYRHCVNRWEKFTDNPPIGEIDNACAKAFQSACQRAELRPETINKTWTHLRTILRRLGPSETRNPLGLGILDHVPHVKALPTRRRIPRFVKQEELNRLYRACETADWPRTIIPPADWWRSLIVVVYNCGPRYQDFIHLTPANFDMGENLLEFEAHKTGKQHVIPLNRVTAAHIERIWSPRDLMFPTGSWPRKIRTEWHALQDAAGIEKHFTFHDLRRTCATVYSKVREDLGGLILGHSVNSVTHMSYLNPAELLREPVEKVEQPSEFLKILEEPRKSVVMEYLLDRERTQWDFRPAFRKGFATYRGKPIMLHPRRMAVLKCLVSAGPDRPLSFADLRIVVWWDRPNVTDTVIKTTVCDLAKDLRNALELPESWDPIPWRREAGWFLDFPLDWTP